MSKRNKTNAGVNLSFVDIVMGAEAETIKAAYEARMQIDTLLEQRQQAYIQICQLEEQVENLLGEDGIFEFPAPPLPVAGVNSSSSMLRSSARPAAAKSTPRATASSTTASESESESETATAAATTTTTAAAMTTPADSALAETTTDKD